MRHAMRFMVIGGLAMSLAVGCAHQTRTTRVERTVTYPAQTQVVEQETTTKTRQEPEGGVLSTTVHIVGQVLALPFRLVGGLIQLIF